MKEASIAAKNHATINFIHMEVERVKFLLRHYLRSRLTKIEKHSAHLLQTPSMMTRLDVAEASYAKRYVFSMQYDDGGAAIETWCCTIT